MRSDFLNAFRPARDGGGLIITGAGEARRVTDYVDHTVQVSGTFTATLDIEVSLDDVTWTKVQTGVSAAGLFQWRGHAFRSMRINVTAYTSGEPVVVMGGLNHRCDP